MEHSELSGAIKRHSDTIADALMNGCDIELRAYSRFDGIKILAVTRKNLVGGSDRGNYRKIGGSAAENQEVETNWFD